MHRLIVIVLALLPAAALAAEPADIAVVETWDDLAKRPAIELEKGPTVRVGIESHAMPRYGGLALYLLVDGDEWSTPTDRGDGIIGPLTIKIEAHERVEELIKIQEIQRQIRNAEWAGADRLLFVATVPYGPGGPLTVSVIHGEKTVIARATVKTFDANTHPWLAFDRGGLDGSLDLVVGDEAIEAVSPNLFRAAVPQYDGDRPFDWQNKNDDVDPDRPLPRLIPEKGPALNVTVRRVRERHELIVKFPEQIMSATIGQHLLARWWVDGEPIIAPLVAREQEQMAQQARRFMRSDTLRLRLEIPDGAFGSFGGERVQLELLYCPDGVEDSGDHRFAQQMEQMFVHGQKQRQRVPMRSNRVEFHMPHKFAMR